MDATRFIVAGNFIDGSGAGARRNVFLAVAHGFITAIGPATELPERTGTPVDDLSHCTIVPAMVDCSVSLTRSPSLKSGKRPVVEQAGWEEKAANAARHIRYCHAHGVLGVAVSDDLSGLPEVQRKGRAPEGIIDIRSSGNDFIRIAFSPDIDDVQAPSPRPLPDGLRRILAHRGGKKAIGTANGARQVQEALAAGCDAIEQGYGMNEESLGEMARRNVLWIPGILRAKNGLDAAGSGGSVCCRFSTRYVAPGKPLPGAEAFWKKMLTEQLGLLRLARKLGVTTAMGTGAGNVGILHGESLVEEMKLFIKAGYPLEEAIRCASENGARFFGMKKPGVLSVGRPATFLVARGTVKQLPRKLAYLEDIYVDGAPSIAYRKNPWPPDYA